MKELVVIRLASTEHEPVHWLVWSESEQEIIASGVLENAQALSSISEHCRDRLVKVLVPAMDVMLKRVYLPSKLNRKLTNALPYMLEEDLAQDIDELHFVVLESGEQDGKYFADVAVVSIDLLDQWLGQLATAEINTQFIYPDALCLPLHGDDSSTMTKLDQQWVIRISRNGGTNVDYSWVSLFIQQIVKLKGGEPKVHTYDAELVKSIPETAELCDFIEEPPELTMKLLTQGTTDCDANLLQGDYLPQSDHLKAAMKWRNFAIAAGIAFVTLVIYKGIQINVLQKELDAKKQELVTQYQAAFPREKVRPQLINQQLNSKLKSIGVQAQGGTGFVEQLIDVLPVLGKQYGLQPETLKFDKPRGEIRFQGRANDFQSFEKIKLVLEQKGYKVDQGALNNDGDTVVGSFIVRLI